MSDTVIGFKVKAFAGNLAADIKYVADEATAAKFVKYFETQGYTAIIKPIMELPADKDTFDELP